MESEQAREAMRSKQRLETLKWHIFWFGEMDDNMAKAFRICARPREASLQGWPFCMQKNGSGWIFYLSDILRKGPAYTPNHPYPNFYSKAPYSSIFHYLPSCWMVRCFERRHAVLHSHISDIEVSKLSANRKRWRLGYGRHLDTPLPVQNSNPVRTWML